MIKNSNITKVAVFQSAPILFDRDATVNKTIELLDSIKGQNINLTLFPEAFIPAYPRGLSFGMVVGNRNPLGRETWKRYWDNAVDVPSPTTEKLGKAAQDINSYLAIGVIEKDPISHGTLYCTTLYFGPNGKLLGKHRKIKPTGSERLIWGEGDGSTLTVIDSEIGKFGGLTCWENYMPLARMAIYNQGVEIYLAPTADSRDTWQSSMIHIACEGRCFVLGCNQFVTKSMVPKNIPGYEELTNLPETMCRGGSVIISPMGQILAGPLWDQEGILTAELDMDDLIKSKMDFDVIGHYSRPDIFELKINRAATLF